MTVFLNGRFVPEEEARVSVFDRGFLYGDGLFETIRIYNGNPFRWDQHCARLQQGAEFLRIRLPGDPPALKLACHELIRQNGMSEAVLRISLSRGTGPRGYSTRGADQPCLVMSLHPPPSLDPARPPQWRLITSSFRVPADDPIAQFKTASKLLHVLARTEAETKGADEALLLNTRGEVAEAASGNVFWIESQTVCTTPIACGILPGVTRAVILELCAQLQIAAEERSVAAAQLRNVQSVFLTLSTLEIVEVIEWDGRRFAGSPVLQQLRGAYRQTVLRETSISKAPIP